MKAVREFLSEVTDIDNKLLRTFIGLFRNPQRVVEVSLEDEHTYTKPLRYLLSTSTMFIIWRFLYERYVHGFFGEPYWEVDDWYLPERIAKASSLFINLQDTFFPFQILFFVVPLAIIAIKFLFGRKSWKEARYTTLYSFGQFWTILMVFVPVMTAFDTQLVPVLIAFGLIGFFFRKLLSKKTWMGLAKWLALGYVLTIWFYHLTLPFTQWGLVQVALSDKHHEMREPLKPLEEITLQPPIDWVQFITGDPDDRYLNILYKEEGLIIQCYQPDTTLLWQTPLPGVIHTRNIVGVRLPSSERGIIVLADAMLPKTSQAILISAKGQILFTKNYGEEMIVNSGELVGETLVITGGKSNADGIVPVIDVLRLKLEPEKGVFKLATEAEYSLPDIGSRFDEVYSVRPSEGTLDLVVSKYEMMADAWDINGVSILRVEIDSTLRTSWEVEVFKRTSKYSFTKNENLQMRYDPAYQRIVAYYSVADDKKLSAHLFSIDTLGTIRLQKKVDANELTFLSEVYSAEEGIYFCGWTHSGIHSPLLGLGTQGLMGFVSNDGRTSHVTVGKDSQGDALLFHKIVAKDSIAAWGVRVHHILIREVDWQLMKFDRQVFGQ